MAHAEVENGTPYAFAPLHVADEEGRPVFVPLIQATFRISPATGATLAEEQSGVRLGGEIWEEREEPCYRHEAQVAFGKRGTDVVLNGHAHARRRGTTEQLALLRVGPLQKTVRVWGERAWRRRLGLIRPSRPQPFERIRLSFDNAFGGWDRTHEDPGEHRCEPRNPVGRGFRRRRSRFEEGQLLPNLEDPEQPLVRWGATPPPACFGLVSPGWSPRSELAGTYDQAWLDRRSPGLPTDFRPAFFQAASPGLCSARPLRGGEAVRIEGIAAQGTLRFQLPRIEAPTCRVGLLNRIDRVVTTQLDTVTFDTDEQLVTLLFRGQLRLRDGPHDVRTIEVRSADPLSRAA